MIKTPIHFDHFEWLDSDDSDLSQVTDYLKNQNMDEVATLLQANPSSRPSFAIVGSAIVATFQFPNLTTQSHDLIPATLKLILTEKCVITIHPIDFQTAKLVQQNVGNGKIPKTISPSNFVGQLLKQAVDLRFTFIDGLSSKADLLESRVFDPADSTDLIKDLMGLKMTISRALQIAPPQRAVVSGMCREIKRLNGMSYGDLKEVIHQIEHIVILLNGLKDRADIITESNEAFVNHSLNSTLKILTIFSVITIPPTLIVGLFGINVGVPWEGQRLGFLWVCLILLGITTFGVWFLKSRKIS